MNKVELKEKIYNGIREDLYEIGFRLVKSKDSFERRKDGHKQILKFDFHSRTGETAIQMNVLIQNLDVHRIYNKATGHHLSYTIGNELGILINNNEGAIQNHESIEFSIMNSCDVDKELMRIRQYLHQKALSYFDENTSLKRIDQILNDNPDIINAHSNIQYFRFPLGLIVARLIERQNYDQLETTFDEKMKNVAPLFKERYEKVKDYIRHKL